MNRVYLVGDTNGTFLSSKEDETTTNEVENAQVFTTIGDAMRACVNYNVMAYTFRVIPFG